MIFRWMLTTIAIGIGLVGFEMAVSAGGEEVPIVGKYSYKAKLQGGGTEQGFVEVHKHGDTYKMKWTHDKGSYTGIGIRTGDHLSICYSYPGDGERGIYAMKIMKGPHLEGRYSALGSNGKLHHETWTFLPK